MEDGSCKPAIQIWVDDREARGSGVAARLAEMEDVSLTGKRAIQLRVLTSFPRIGSKRALRLIERFGTLEHVMAATPEELAAVPGIGKRTAQQIHWAVHEESLPYRM